MNFQKTNNLTGWIVFGIALLTYWLTFEETASYWDCGEFIAVSYKLEVPHPPGAPLFLLLGRIFSFLAFGDVTKVAYWINFLSVLGSAFTILFLFWSITLFGRKMIGAKKDADITTDQTLMLMGAGVVGALAYTFSDSFWFSAVEAEVYAMSSFFTAFVVWGVLKWDVIDDESKANRWLILIAYMVGLSIGVHMLNLVTIPALALIYYFKKYTPTFWGVVASLAIGGGLVLFINDLIVPGLPSIAGIFEITFVNTLGLPFGSGAVFFALLIVAALVFGIFYTQRKQKVVWNTFLLATTVILIGYLSYAIIVIRSNYNTGINENAPKDAMSFVKYLKREQYGSRPLLWGPYFTAQPTGIEYGAPIYVKGKDKYEVSERKFSYTYPPGEETLLPRLWYSDQKQEYMDLLGLKEGERPTFAQNMYYMFQHQIGTMYMRYFMWNFAGRESDEFSADWLSPRQWGEKLPELLAKNEGRNNYFMIPFILGLLGMFFHSTKDAKNFAVVGLLFIMMGIAIVVYLNSPPSEPRERDYIYAGSFYAFAFWIGLAVIGLAETFQAIFRKWKVAIAVATLIGLSAPAVMAWQGWDDHNRSNRFFSVDSAKNYLNSCAPNAVLYTGGDNDTFPLWYAQEVEGVRTDVRVVVLSYYNTDWYIEQTMQPSYESTPFQYTLSLYQYRQGGPNDYLRYYDLKIPSIDLKEYLGLLSKDYPQLQVEGTNIVPSKVFTLDINKDEVIRKGIIPKGMDSLVVDQMIIRLKGGALEKKDLAILDVLANANWDRPIYLNNTSLSQIHVDLSPYIVQEGNAYRIVPIRNPNPRKEFVNTDAGYEIALKKFAYRGLDDEKVYYNNDYRGFVMNHRSSLNSLAEALYEKGEKERAHDVVMFSLSKMPDKAVPYDFSVIGLQDSKGLIELLFLTGEKEKATEVARVMGDRSAEMIEYLMGKGQGFSTDGQRSLYILGELQNVLYRYGEEELAKKYEDIYQRTVDALQLMDGNRRNY